MPRQNGGGPLGRGAMTGRGLGRCNANAKQPNTFSSPSTGFGCGRGQGRGFGRCLAAGPHPLTTQKELLQEQKKMLEDKLQLINQQLANL
ncbi:DUF5320 domain-containing protein [Desulforamulus hydrothermalis]|uniref:Cytoplasmic protein n=1 Tax=Desulforamulus hydrothermalis Lam5 = DSM 18033 TaxID=1121428 RepID=K8DXX7_9FIRM|nr:DUF5320 domain-containing protein [Desulforamulus hydrothermalis]CCO07534.1 conserved hypothetical protein [Desulforamulus hydrothermalis Lam5 = DSM 18033]SHH30810.1 hypothetical protein SAMN02745177_02148 [Desulforamulus hydrothermalis Lam5 = DSM 18033]